MSTENVRGLIIKETMSGEADKYITVLTEGAGKITLLARGARKPKSKLMSAASLFVYGDFFYFQGSGFKSLNSADILDGFYGLQTDYDRLVYASYVAEAADKTGYDDTAELLHLVLYTLTALAKTRMNPALIVCAFRFKLLDIMGFLNTETTCLNCGSGADYFSPNEGGFVCAECAAGCADAERVSIGFKKAFDHITGQDMKSMFSFNVSEGVFDELNRLSDRCIRLYIDSGFKTDKLINAL